LPAPSPPAPAPPSRNYHYNCREPQYIARARAKPGPINSSQERGGGKIKTQPLITKKRGGGTERQRARERKEEKVSR